MIEPCHHYGCNELHGCSHRVVVTINYDWLIDELKKRCELPIDVERALKAMDSEQ